MPLDADFFESQHNKWVGEVTDSLKGFNDEIEKSVKKMKDLEDAGDSSSDIYKKLSQRVAELKLQQEKYKSALEDTTKSEKENFVTLNQKTELFTRIIEGIAKYSGKMGETSRTVAEFNAIMENSAERMKSFAQMSDDNIGSLDTIRTTLKLTKAEFGNLVTSLEPLTNLKIDFRDLDKLAKKLIEVRGYAVGSKEFKDLVSAEGKTRGLAAALASGNQDRINAYVSTGRYSREERLAIQDTRSSRKEENDATGTAKDFEVLLDNSLEAGLRPLSKIAGPLTMVGSSLEILMKGLGAVAGLAISYKAIGSIASEFRGGDHKEKEKSFLKAYTDKARSAKDTAVSVMGGGGDTVALLRQIAYNTAKLREGGGMGGIFDGGSGGGGITDLLDDPRGVKPPKGKGWKAWLGRFKPSKASLIKGGLSLGGLAASVGGMALSNYLGEDHPASKAIDTAGTIGTYASIGAMAGSVIPGVGTMVGGGLGAAIGAYRNRNEIYKHITDGIKYFSGEGEKKESPLDVDALAFRYQESQGLIDQAKDETKNSFSKEIAQASIAKAKQSMLTGGQFGDLSGLTSEMGGNVDKFLGRTQDVQFQKSIENVETAKRQKAKASTPEELKQADEALKAAEATLASDTRLIINGIKEFTDVTQTIGEVEEASKAFQENLRTQIDTAKSSVDLFGSLTGNYEDIEKAQQQANQLLQNQKDTSAQRLKLMDNALQINQQGRDKAANEVQTAKKNLEDLKQKGATEEQIQQAQSRIATAEQTLQAQQTAYDAKRAELERESVNQKKVILQATIDQIRLSEELFAQQSTFMRATGNRSFRQTQFGAFEQEQGLGLLKGRQGIAAARLAGASEFGTPTTLKAAYAENNKILTEVAQKERELAETHKEMAKQIDGTLGPERERIEQLRSQAAAATDETEKQRILAQVTEAESKYTEQLEKKNAILNKASQSEATAIQAETERRSSEIKQIQEVAGKKTYQLDTEKYMLDQNIELAQKMGASYPAILQMEKQRINVMEQQRKVLAESIQQMEAQIPAEQQAFNQPLQEAKKQLKSLSNTILEETYGQNRNFMDKALGSMFGVSNGSAAQPVLNNRLIAGGGSYLIGMNGEIIRGQGMTHQQRANMLRPSVPGAFGAQDPAVAAENAFKEAKSVAVTTKEAFESLAQDGITLNVNISGGGGNVTADVVESPAFKIAVRKQIEQFATRPA